MNFQYGAETVQLGSCLKYFHILMDHIKLC